MAEDQIKLLQTLRSKIESLMQRCTQSAHRQAELMQQLHDKDQTIEALHKELKTATSKYQNLKMAHTLPYSSEEEKQQMKQRINGLVREIDKCITRLNGTMQ